jgi:hypothetical protein
MNTADGFGRVVRYLSHVYNSGKGVLGIDLGASQTTIAAGFGGDLRLHVRTDLGLGSAVTGVLRHASAADIGRWLPIQVPEPPSRLHLQQGPPSRHHSGANGELHMEYAWREIIRLALASAARTGRRPGPAPGPASGDGTDSGQQACSPGAAADTPRWRSSTVCNRLALRRSSSIRTA